MTAPGRQRIWVRRWCRPLGDRDLVHDAAGRADHVIFCHLAQPCDPCGLKVQFQIGVEAAQGADFHCRGTAYPYVHGHGAQQQQIEAVGEFHRLLFEQGKNTAADVGGPDRQRVGVAEFAEIVIAGQAVAGGEIIERDACLDRQAALADLHGADTQRTVGAGLQGNKHAADQHRFADVCAGIVGDAAHNVEPGRHACHAEFPAVEKSGQAGRVAVRFLEQPFKFHGFKGQLFC